MNANKEMRRKNNQFIEVLKMRDKQLESCLSCKVISVCCLMGVGGYMFYQGKMQPGNSKFAFYLLSSAATGLGIGEIFDKSPFRDAK